MLKKFFNKEILGGILLVLATIVALSITNFGGFEAYTHFFHTPIVISFGEFELNYSFSHWINDGLMAIFFFLIGLELKKEIFQGHLQHIQSIIIPAIAALGGVLVPIIIYVLFNINSSENLKGWAIPMATDIAFSVGVLALFGKMIPTKMRVFLLTLAVIDDIVAIIVIAVFYSGNINTTAVLVIFLILLVLLLINRLKVDNTIIYIVLGVILWVAFLKSGLHATLAGVILAFFIPLKKEKCNFHYLEHNLAPFVAFIVMPLFALSNTGIYLGDINFIDILDTVTLGIIFALLLGKPIGIYFLTKLYTKITKTKLLISNKELIAVSLLAAIGFTMSLFLAELSFSNNEQLLNLARLGIIISSLFAVIISLIFIIIKFKKVK